MKIKCDDLETSVQSLQAICSKMEEDHEKEKQSAINSAYKRVGPGGTVKDISRADAEANLWALIAADHIC